VKCQATAPDKSCLSTDHQKQVRRRAHEMEGSGGSLSPLGVSYTPPCSRYGIVWRSPAFPGCWPARLKTCRRQVSQYLKCAETEVDDTQRGVCVARVRTLLGLAGDPGAEQGAMSWGVDTRHY
jgi:hypothetical protein